MVRRTIYYIGSDLKQYKNGKEEDHKKALKAKAAIEKKFMAAVTSLEAAEKPEAKR